MGGFWEKEGIWQGKKRKLVNILQTKIMPFNYFLKDDILVSILNPLKLIIMIKFKVKSLNEKINSKYTTFIFLLPLSIIKMPLFIFSPSHTKSFLVIFLSMDALKMLN